jgi:acyl-CoA thioesterase I
MSSPVPGMMRNWQRTIDVLYAMPLVSFALAFARASSARRGVPAALLAVTVAACGSAPEGVGVGSGPAPAAPPPAAAPAPAAPARAPAPARPRVVVLGDSIAAGYGLRREESFPARLQERIDREGHRFEVVNAGVSGDTSAGGLRRLDWALDGDVRVVIVELGGNDGLRGLPPEELRKNLVAIVRAAKARHLAVLLCGMEAPPNAGPSYATAFRDVYATVAREEHVPLVRFVLDGVAGIETLNQQDGIHPNVEGAKRVADTVWPALEPLLDAVSRA